MNVKNAVSTETEITLDKISLYSTKKSQKQNCKHLPSFDEDHL